MAINAHLASGASSYRSAGISAYIRNLLHALKAEDGLYFKVLVGRDSNPEGAPLPLVRSTIPTATPLPRILWEQLALPAVLRRINADLLHAPAFVGPLLSHKPQVITVHDLSFMRYPAFFRRGNRLYLRTMTGIACRRASAVIAVSDFTKQEVVNLLKVPDSRVHTIYHGVQPRFCPRPREEVARFRAQQGLPERFILYMGTLEPRKNLLTLLRAFARLHDPTLHLVLAGGKGWLYDEIFDEIAALGINEVVHLPGYVPSDMQALWYNAAMAFAYLSHYEGFGLPIIEAQACGTPVLTGNTTALPEAAGDAALLVPPENVEAVAEGLHRLIRDTALRDTLRQRGRNHAAQFTWEKTAAQTTRLYRNILMEKRGS